MEQATIDLSDLKFISDDHIRYQNGQDVSGNNKNSWRGIRVQNNISGGKGFTVTIYNLEGNHPVWGNNIQMAPKQMEIINSSNVAIELRGFGKDQLGNTFRDYGLILHILNSEVTKITLKMFDRNIDILYYKPIIKESINTNLTLKEVAQKLVKQHFEHYLSTNQAISVDDLEADIANLMVYLKLYRMNLTVFNLSFLDTRLLQFIRDGPEDKFAAVVINETTLLYPQHYNKGNGFSSLQIAQKNSLQYGEAELINFLKKEYRERHFYNA